LAEPENRVIFAHLVNWMEGRLSARETREVDEAVASAEAGDDDATLADVAWLRKFFAATENARSELPPRELRNVLVDVFEAHARDRKSPGIVDRVAAALTFDSNLQPAAGLRAVGARPSRRQLIYGTDAFDLVVNILARGTDNDLDLDGQMLPHEGEDTEFLSVQLLRDGKEQVLTTIDDLGSFAFRGVPPGGYELVLSAGRLEMSVRPFDVDL
jgi:hypothetical protein